MTWLSKLREAQEKYKDTADKKRHGSMTHTNSLLVNCEENADNETFERCLSSVVAEKRGSDDSNRTAIDRRSLTSQDSINKGTVGVSNRVRSRENSREGASDLNIKNGGTGSVQVGSVQTGNISQAVATQQGLASNSSPNVGQTSVTNANSPSAAFTLTESNG